jgi:hypothetical protein
MDAIDKKGQAMLHRLVQDTHAELIVAIDALGFGAEKSIRDKTEIVQSICFAIH